MADASYILESARSKARLKGWRWGTLEPPVVRRVRLSGFVKPRTAERRFDEGMVCIIATPGRWIGQTLMAGCQSADGGWSTKMFEQVKIVAYPSLIDLTLDGINYQMRYGIYHQKEDGELET
jgi:hypothetical protein